MASFSLTEIDSCPLCRLKSNITGPLEPTCIYAADSSRSSSMAWRPTLPCILWATTSDCKVPPLFTISSVDSPAYQLQLRVWPLQMTLTQITDLDLWPCSFRSDWQPGCKALIRRPPQEKRLQQTHPPRGQQQWQADRPTGAALVPAYWCGESLFLFQYWRNEDRFRKIIGRIFLWNIRWKEQNKPQSREVRINKWESSVEWDIILRSMLDTFEAG